MAKTKKDKKKPGPAAADQVLLAEEILNSSLSEVARTVDGSGYAYVRLNCTGKNVTKIPEEIATFVHLRYIDISDNHLDDILPLTKLPHVLFLNAARNSITDISCLTDETCLPSCAVLNLSNNSISKLCSIGLPHLAKLTLDGNPFVSFEGVDRLPDSLMHLSVRDSHLSTLSHLPSLPGLAYLSLANCPIDSLTDVSMLAALKILDISGVRLSDFSSLKELLLLPSLQELTVSSIDPEMPDEDFRREILVILRRLHKLNGVDVTPEEKKRAKALKLQRKREQEKAEEQKRRQEEEKARHEKQPDDEDGIADAEALPDDQEEGA
ncbi:B7 isoform, related [Neospora caninum Liverpool]|uniref:B7 isoform, related n=1 Tax=Neospora caninum (strain Liverpool) TaxID=572307 RepID=F0VRC5_NEOCL|nr:B7 isoform, related [Neospora caninum Liverpool]CBZ56273.1 B7 isoform, related [Neospora caninum Liverpool]CEL71036.1 TPA: B7 isoform, related [Neospora caninum Liverpool]|eukprot:XP_003886298.1 B7 isoform, related [Neospora caninum Liverpool]